MNTAQNKRRTTMNKEDIGEIDWNEIELEIRQYFYKWNTVRDFHFAPKEIGRRIKAAIVGIELLVMQHRSWKVKPSMGTTASQRSSGKMCHAQGVT
jgi:hypothetical protein